MNSYFFIFNQTDIYLLSTYFIIIAYIPENTVMSESDCFLRKDYRNAKKFMRGFFNFLIGGGRFSSFSFISSAAELLRKSRSAYWRNLSGNDKPKRFWL